MFSIEETFFLLTSSVYKNSTDELIEKCKDIGMIEQPYMDTGLEENLPEFDKGYVFTYKTDDNHIARMEILVKGGRTLQAGIQIIYPKRLFSSKLNRHYDLVVGIAENFYGLGVPMNIGNIEVLNYGNNETVFYVFKSNMNNRGVLTFKVGNKEFWR